MGRRACHPGSGRLRCCSLTSCAPFQRSPGTLPGAGAVGHRRGHRRQPPCRSRRSVRGAAGHPGRWPQLHRRCGEARRGRGPGAVRHDLAAGRAAAADHLRCGAAAVPGADRGGAGRPAAGDRGRRHRHQRQDQHGGVHPPALGLGRREGRQPRHARPDRPRLRTRPRPDHARSGQPGRDAGRPRAARRQPRGDRGVVARPGPVPAGRRAAGRRRRSPT